MKKIIRIVCTFILILAFFASAEFLPEIICRWQDRTSTKLSATTKDSFSIQTATTSVSYKDQLAVLSQPKLNLTDVLTINDPTQLTDYDENFFIKLQKQIHLLYTMNLLSDDPTTDTLTGDFQKAKYISIQASDADNNFCLWDLTFITSKDKQEYEFCFDPNREKIYFINIHGIHSSLISEYANRLAKYYDCKLRLNNQSNGNASYNSDQNLQSQKSDRPFDSYKITTMQQITNTHTDRLPVTPVKEIRESTSDMLSISCVFLPNTYSIKIPTTILFSGNLNANDIHLNASFGNLYLDSWIAYPASSSVY